MKILHLLLMMVLAIPLCGRAAGDDSEVPATRKQNLAAVDKAYKADIDKYAGKKDFLVRKGLVADRKNKIIRMHAEATDVKGGSLVEFFCIALNSGHDYEALSVSFSSAGDLLDALKFIGMKPGRPSNPRKHAFWPKGERVIMKINGTRAEQYMINDKTGKPCKLHGLVFTGGLMLEPKDEPGTKVVAADVREPASIASNYNEVESILDVPRRAPQRTVYGNNILNKETRLPTGKLIEITIEPEYKDGKVRVVDVPVTVRPGKVKGETYCELSDGSSKSFVELAEYLAGLLKKGHDPYLAVTFADDLPALSARNFTRTVSLIETDDGIRSEGPAEGGIFFHAYDPPRHFLKRETRVAQPFELELVKSGSSVTGALHRIEQEWKDGSPKAKLTVSSYPVTTPEELVSATEKVKADVPVILVICNGNVTCGEISSYIKPLIKKYPIIHVFADEKNAPAK